MSEVISDLKRKTVSGDLTERDVKKVKTGEPNEAREPRVPQKSIQEADVGITEYVYNGPSKKIRGVLKQRYTDFLVNEIGLDGKVIHLEDLGFDIPKKDKAEEEKRKKKEQHDKEESERIEKESFHIGDEEKSQLIELLGEQDTEKLIQLVGSHDTMETSKALTDKEERTKVHKLIRKAFDNRLETATTDDNRLRIGVNNYRKSGNRHSNNSSSSPALVHNLGPRKGFLRFSMYKENKETMEVANILAKILRVPVKCIKYAGTKDRRGVTVQRASMENVPIERANSLNRILRGCQIGAFEYSDIPVNLAALEGNEFIITIRDAELIDPAANLEETVKPILESLKEIGFVNYYGLQRFGTFSVSTHQVGKEILNGHWKDAGELILSEQEVVVPSSRDARKIWKQTKDAKLALKRMPRKCSAEFSLLSRLDRSEKESDGEYSEGAYFNAIMGIPRNLRIMYAHSYQSYVWNVVTSHRIHLFGLRVVPGDLVLVENVIEDNNGTEDVKREKVTGVRVLTEEDVSSGKYTIDDIVLPTPGFDVVYPENEKLKNAYVDVMKKDGLDPFQMSRRVREFSLPGSYRKIISQTGNLEYFIRRYDSYTDELLRTDLGMLELRKQAKVDGKADDPIEQILPGNPEGSKTALIIKMQLPSSTYATMALRELLAN
ncbi:DEKNAAC102017 [Brettanomyces naardenensis]|uniref:DEKNAAC102017 n=1 Tax=Brettanomyces naardenensis TaxID=13370 RepID=A0A448YJM8_BRENA|nr:DEKNAAC102017 [Brettanomyces naardenensis]